MSAIPARVRTLVVTRDRYLCVRCAVKGTDLHHRRGRSIPGEHCHCACNLILLCRTCHSWAHHEPFAARTKGLIVSRAVDQPSTEPAQTYLGALLLDCDGGFMFHVKLPPTEGVI